MFVMHVIQVLIGMNEVMEIFEDRWTTTKSFPLTSDMAIVPVNESLVVEMIGRGIEWPDLEEIAFEEDLTKILEPILCSLRKSSLPGQVAFLMTQYFGGVGAQVAALVDPKGALDKVFLGPESINTALSELGVCRDMATGLDEFATIGLGRWRSNNDILEDILSI